MSFSKDVKEELSLQLGDARHCRLAELAAILSFSGHIIVTEKGYYLKLVTESLVVARKYFTLIRKTFNINIDISVRRNSISTENLTYTLMIRDNDLVIRILQATKLPYENLVSGEAGKSSQLIVQNTCCKRAFIRGAFLTSGSMSNPKKAYHLEIVLTDSEKAQQLKYMIQSFSIDAKIVIRKRSHVVYIKEGSQIVDLLNIMEAHVALMNLENVRILKEMRNQVNRQVNCETANIEKTVIASSKQIEDISYIRDKIGFGDLAEGLGDIARLRITHPEASLKELGDMLSPTIGKSGVNHRLRKLSMIAEYFREHKEGNSNDNERNSN
ncbi:MAG TPA: DNA-binding protein WhiA [Mobilitalea sp.]|nr:DNA-binding protein WhiA [Mobilitalea sp.]